MLSRNHVNAFVLILACGLCTSSPVVAADGVRDVSRTIDQRIETRLKEAGVDPAPRAESAALVRRLYLDVLGRMPSREEVRTFQKDASADRHHQLIDRLLEHEEFPLYWARVFDLWLNGRPAETPYGRDEFLQYLERALEENRTWDRICGELLQPSLEDPVEQGASYFLASRIQKGDDEQKLDRMTTAVAGVFFGVQLQCAKCHDHPLVEQWRQEHYYGLGAFLVRSEARKYRNKPALGERAEGEATFVTAEQEERPAALMFLDGKIFEEPEPAEERDDRYVVPRDNKEGKPAVPKFSRRALLADYALTSDNPYFRKALVNRMWKRLMGRGLVEPVDQMHSQNPPTHPELLHDLADDFAGNGFDVRRLLAAILHSEAYLRSSRWPDGDAPPEEPYAVASLKPLSPEQLAWSLYQATGQDEVLRAKWEREKKKLEVDAVTRVFVRRRLEARDREFAAIVDQFAQEGEEFQANTQQALFLTYGDAVSRMLRRSPGNLLDELLKLEDDEAVAERLYLQVLSREPTAEEAAEVSAYLSGFEEQEREQALADVIWALLASAEFRFVP